jgi:Icc-related predicted phosphoesterase
VNYEDLQAVSLDRIAPALESIAASLAVIAGDITDRREHERLRLGRTYASHKRDVERATQRLAEARQSTEIHSVEYWITALEEAESELSWFVGEYPEVAASAESAVRS